MRKLSQVTEGSAQMVGVVIAGLVAIIIGVLVWYKINTAIYTANGTVVGAQGAVWNNTNASANTIWTLFPIVAIVVVAGVILAVVMGFGRGNGV
jgi:uncharacterized membrane protein YoaT (DUF817 family)